LPTVKKTPQEIKEFFVFISMVYKVYILFSESKNRFYVGFTSNLEERIVRHNQRSKGFTGSVNDWKVVYTELYNTKEEAHNRELQIKAWKSRKKIVELIGWE